MLISEEVDTWLGKDLLSLHVRDFILLTNERYKAGLYAVRKREDDGIVWNEWGEYCFQVKYQFEKEIYTHSIDVIKYLYALVQNRNQLISLYLQSRVGKMSLKKELAKASKLLADLALGVRKPVLPCEVCRKVEDHVLKLATGQFDIIVRKNIFVKDYPEDFRYDPPNMILTPKDILVGDDGGL